MRVGATDPKTPEEARSLIAAGWERLARLLAEEGPAVHATMLCSWGNVVRLEMGAPYLWMIAMNIGGIKPERWGLGVQLCREAVAAEAEAFIRGLGGP